MVADLLAIPCASLPATETTSRKLLLTLHRPVDYLKNVHCTPSTL